MKNFKKYISMAALAAAAVMCFAACDNGAGEVHEHSFKTEWSHDTEYHWHDASCEHTWLQGDRTRHVFKETVIEPATCTGGGLVQRTCACGYTETVPSQPKGHTLTPVAGKQATCKGAGYTDYSVCSVCGTKVGYTPIPSPSHVYGNHWSTDEKTHWQVCVFGCGTETAHEPHFFPNGTEPCVCGATPESNPDLEYAKDFTFEGKGENASQGYIVTGLAAGCEKTEVTIPSYYLGKPVVEIGEGAFAENKTLASIVIPAGIKTIGDFAFDHCESLATADLPLGLTYLGVQAFNGCKQLASVSIPSGITTIQENTFMGCEGLTTLTLHNGLKVIDTQAFAGCKSLNNPTFPAGLTFIGQYAFRGSGISNLTIPEMASGRLASGAFAGCDKLIYATLSGGFDYQVGQIFADCKALQMIVVPFIGAYGKEAQANTAGVTTAFGYFFGSHAPKAADAELYISAEQGGVTYYIPKSLTSVTIKGGVVKEGAFDNCTGFTTTPTVQIADGVKVETITFKNCNMKFEYNGNLPGPDITVSVDKTKVTVGVAADVVTLTYTTNPNAQNVTVTVKKGDAVAEEGAGKDYTKVDGEEKYTFLKAGTYTFEVSATYNNKTETKTSAEITVELPGPNLGKIIVSGTGYENELCNMDTELTFTFTYEGGNDTTIEVTIQKDGAPAEQGTDKDYTKTEGEGYKYTFLKAGSYTVTVKATRNRKDETESVTFRVVDPAAAKPTITSFTASKNTMVEGAEEEITLTFNATYIDGDEAGSHEYTVLRKNGANYEAAEKEYYELKTGTTDTFKALVAGEYKIELTVVGKLGGVAKSTDDEGQKVEISVTAAQLTLTLTDGQTTNNWVRRTPSNDEAITYTVEGYAFGYDVTYTKDIDSATISAASGKTGVVVGIDAVNTVNYKVVYTHKVLTETKYELSIPVSFVSDLASSPVLGSDPFGGTYGVIYAATGLQLYYDVTDGEEGEQLALSEISFKAGSLNTTGKSLTVEHIAHDDAQPWYTITEDWGSGKDTGIATGRVSIVLTATKNGQTAAATMEFEVKALNDPDSASGMNAYIEEVMKENGGRGALDLDSGLSRGKRENMIIAKDGIYEHRTGDDWGGTADTFCVKVENKDNFQLDFDFKIVKRISPSGSNQKVAFLVNYRGSGWGDWVGEGDTEFYSENGANTPLSIYQNLSNVGEITWDDNGNKPTQDNTIVHLRLKHTVDEGAGKVWFEWTWSYDAEYHPLFKYSATKTSENGKNGSSINAICFRHNLGSVFFGNFVLTDLTAD